MLLYKILPFTIHGKKKQKSLTKIIHLKHQLQHRMKSLNSLMDYILYQILKINFKIY